MLDFVHMCIIKYVAIVQMLMTCRVMKQLKFQNVDWSNQSNSRQYFHFGAELETTTSRSELTFFRKSNILGQNHFQMSAPLLPAKGPSNRRTNLKSTTLVLSKALSLMW